MTFRARFATAAFVVLSALAPCAAFAVDTPCGPPSHAPELRVHFQEQAVSYDFSKGADEIRSQAAGSAAAHEGESVVVRGLTVTHFFWKADVLSERFAAGGGFCAYPAAIDLTIGFSAPTTVFVERDFVDGSCNRAAILEHENHHVAISRDTLDAHMPLIRAAAEQAMDGDGAPVFAADAEEAVNRVDARVEAAIASEISRLEEDREAQNEYLDRPESIEGTLGECRSW